MRKALLLLLIPVVFCVMVFALNAGAESPAGAHPRPGVITSLSVTKLVGILPFANGGTSSSTQQGAINALAGSHTSGTYLRGNGTNDVMSTIQVADVPTLNQSTTGTASNVTGTVAIANGGTGQVTALAALNALTAQPQSAGSYIRSDGANSAFSDLKSADLTGTVPIAHGGTGQATAQAAIDALLPSQTSNSGKFLTTNGSASSWGTAGASPWPLRRFGIWAAAQLTDASLTTWYLPNPTIRGAEAAQLTTDTTQMMQSFAGNGAGTCGGIVGPYTLTRVNFLPKLYTSLQVNSFTTSRVNFAMIDSGNTLCNTATLAASNAYKYASFRFDSTLSDPAWMGCSSDGVTASCTSTGIAAAANTTYALILDFSVAGQTTYWINGTSVLTKTTNQPPTATSYGTEITIGNNGANSLFINRFTVEQN